MLIVQLAIHQENKCTPNNITEHPSKNNRPREYVNCDAFLKTDGLNNDEQ